jgi:hypothetical protein
VAKLLLNSFTTTVVWHILNHRHELNFDDSLREEAGINCFKVLMDKFRALYYSSSKNRRELNACTDVLETEFLRMERIFGTRCVAYNFRTFRDLWYQFAAFYRHFTSAPKDCT